MRSVWISAGESSGDQRAADFIKSCPRKNALDFFGITGPQMRGLEVVSLFDINRLQGIGIAEVFRNIPDTLAILHQCEQRCEIVRPDLAVLVDYGEFHMRLGARLRKMGVPVFHLAPPKIWAWGQWRVKRLSQSASAVGVLFPFEEAFYQDAGIRAFFVGHPAAVPACTPANNPDKLLLLPGSRPSELERHTELMVDTALAAADLTGLKPVLGIANGQQLPGRVNIPSTIDIRQVSSPADYKDGALALAASGTVNIELAAMGIPQVVCYRSSAITAAIARRLVKTTWLNPVNISAGEPLVEELLQADATSATLAEALSRTWRNRREIGEKSLALSVKLQRPGGLKQAWELCESLAHD